MLGLKLGYIQLLLSFFFVLSNAEISSPHDALMDIMNFHSNTTNEKLAKFFSDPSGLKSFMERADPKQIDQVLTFIDTIIADSLKEKEDILSCRDEKQAFVDRALKKRTTETEEHTKLKASLVEAGEKVKELEEKETDARTLVDTLKGQFDVASIDVDNCQEEVDKLTKQVKEETEIYNQIIDLLQECAGNTKTPERFAFIRGPELDNGLATKCSKPFTKLTDAEAACLADNSCGFLHDANCDSKDWRICQISVKKVSGDEKACSFLKPSATNGTVENFEGGPNVDNSIYKKCKETTYTLENAKVACLADKSCEWLHDWGCDNQKWRVCTSSVKKDAGDKKGCSLVRKTSDISNQMQSSGEVDTGKQVSPPTAVTATPAPTAKSEDFKVGPKVDNSLFKKCESKPRSLDAAKALCLADKSCGWIHDWSCDNKNWRVCSSSLARTAGDKKGCSMVRYTKVEDTGDEVIVPTPLKTSFQQKWTLDGWRGFSEINTGYKIPIDGSILRWEYVAGSASGVYFQIYRHTSGTQYKLIGENFVKSSEKGKVTVVNIRTENRINVKQGDFIGWTFIGQPAFGFSTTKGVTRWSTGNGVSYRKIGANFNFPGQGKRLYQCRAVVSSEINTVVPTSAIVPSSLKYSFRSKLTVDGWQSFSEVNTAFQIPSAGVISTWEYVGVSSSGVYLQVYRLVSGNKYKIIGQNFVSKSVNGKTNKIDVQANNRIVVQKGDFIGWTFVGRAAFGFSTTEGVTRWSTGNGVAYKTVGGTFDFPSSGKRLYQCRATVTIGTTGSSDNNSAKKSEVVIPSPLTTNFETNWILDGWQGFSEVNTGYQIPSAGTITQWEYVGGSTSAVYLQVYRLVSSNLYKLIGQNFIKESIVGKNNRISVRLENRIAVQKDDFIGWTFVGKAAFGFSSTQGRTLWSSGSGVAFKTVGKTYTFPGSGKRLYQLRATISG